MNNTWIKTKICLILLVVIIEQYGVNAAKRFKKIVKAISCIDLVSYLFVYFYLVPFVTTLLDIKLNIELQIYSEICIVSTEGKIMKFVVCCEPSIKDKI